MCDHTYILYSVEISGKNPFSFYLTKKKRYTRELYDRPKASLLQIKARMVTSEIVETILHGCSTWTPLKGPYNKLRTTHQKILLRILEGLA